MPDAQGVQLTPEDRSIESELDALLAADRPPRGKSILVNNEVGLGIVPENALARALRDMAGTINQRLSATAGHVHLIAASHAMRLKIGRSSM